MVQAIKERSLHGFTSFYRKFIKDLITIARSLIDVTKKMNGFIWEIYSPHLEFAHNFTILYSSCEVDYGFKLLISFALMSLSIDHALSLDRKRKNKFESFDDEGQVSKLHIISTISKDYLRE
ncbi:hypothetical protein M9H77_35716 [Catharanthus roseus]|uniref:Uncharacterized protein n=1 Tax=Catharanthus roseus TaxID=4058 RepID=A0ACB9ZR27_CATRO|nr:hypothetical protein M9H77_35716 [Catharanthus roseus]